MSRMKDFLMTVLEMHSNGCTLEQISEATGMPVEYIREIVLSYDENDETEPS